jgi:hypothetical protein
MIDESWIGRDVEGYDCAVVEVLSQNLPRGTEVRSNIAGVPAEIPTKHLPNTSPGQYVRWIFLCVNEAQKNVYFLMVHLTRFQSWLHCVEAQGKYAFNMAMVTHKRILTS